MNELIQTLTVYAIPVVFAITLHEAAHGYAARYFGDMTATLAGRVSLNPMRHVDLVGTFLVPIGILLASRLLGGPAMLFGWAKPVPVDFGRMRKPKQDMLWVALAGPVTNILQALGWTLVIRILLALGLEEGFWMEMAKVGIDVNIVLMALNLLPVLPLDGGRVVFSLLPHRLAWQYGKTERYGMLIIIALLALGALPVIIEPFRVAGYWVVQLFFSAIR